MLTWGGALTGKSTPLPAVTGDGWPDVSAGAGAGPPPTPASDVDGEPVGAGSAGVGAAGTPSCGAAMAGMSIALTPMRSMTGGLRACFRAVVAVGATALPTVVVVDVDEVTLERFLDAMMGSFEGHRFEAPTRPPGPGIDCYGPGIHCDGLGVCRCRLRVECSGRRIRRSRLRVRLTELRVDSSRLGVRCDGLDRGRRRVGASELRQRAGSSGSTPGVCARE